MNNKLKALLEEALKESSKDLNNSQALYTSSILALLLAANAHPNSAVLAVFANESCSLMRRLFEAAK